MRSTFGTERENFEHTGVLTMFEAELQIGMPNVSKMRIAWINTIF
jgi:hypothetical protein